MIRPEGVHNKVWSGYKNIAFCIIDYLVKQGGVTNLRNIEQHTGLKKIGVQWAADVLRLLAKEGNITLEGSTVIADIEKLTAILEQAKTNLPKNYGKPWSEDDIVVMCSLALDKMDVHNIAKRLERTEKAVLLCMSRLRFAYRLIPIIDRNSVVRDFASNQKTPNPKR